MPTDPPTRFALPPQVRCPNTCPPLRPSQLFIQRERAAVLAEAQTDDLIKEAPKPALDKSGEWQETGGEIQWVANDNNDANDANRQDDAKEKQKDEEDEELDLNKGVVVVVAGGCHAGSL